MERRGATEQLAAFATNLELIFTNEVIEQGKRMLLDQFACQISGAPLPWSRAYRESVTALGPGSGASVVYYGDAASLDEAAFLNSAFGHGNEFDDTHLASATHPGSVIVPAVMALAENGHHSGRRTLEAVIVGAEIMIRLGAAAAPHLHDRGFYVPSSVGPFGAAAACARLLGFTAERCRNAMAIAGSHSSGLKAFQEGGGSVKRIVCAIPSMAGLRAAIMAQHGITGPHAVIEGKRGFLNVFAGGADLELLTAGLGTNFHLLGLAFKPVACNLSTHASVEAVGWLRGEYDLKPDDVAAIEIGVSASAIGDVGQIVEPPDILGAQSSLAFGAVVRMFRGGNGPHDYHEEDLHDPRCLDLVHRVALHVDPVCDEERRTLKNRGAVVTIRTRDGRALEKRVRFPKGSPENPLTNAELTAKFTAAVEPLLGADRTAHIAERVWDIEEIADAGTLLPLTLAQAPAAR